ncbi:PepSY domain-containing protein [Algoriphagus namhaensis]|uniref:PepSY domain-containing protein n=1 Tax=Algoriphagus namhaensis TaxID=915353 RepID=A0ABV8AVP5_9BACT
MQQEKLQVKVRRLRRMRIIHRWLGVPLMIFFLVIGITSILLAWKKKVELLPPTQSSEVQRQGEWIPTEKMLAIAITEMDSRSLSSLVDRIDIRPDKGIAKVTFEEHFTEVQIDGYSGEILSVATRHSDWIEKVHDGSIVDFYFGNTETAKLVYSSATAFGLLLMSLSGFYLWYFPKVIRKTKQG